MKKNPQNILANIRYLAMLILFIGIQIAFAQTSAIWNGNIDTDWYTNNTSASEYAITTAEQLAGLAKLVNEGNSFKGKTVKLGRNIMLNDTANWQNWTSKPPKNKWTPIGTKDSLHIFNGVFNGGSYAVSGIYINTTDNGQGLFRNVGSSGAIKNLGITASYIKGGISIGGLAGGYNEGTINNSYFIGTVVGDRSVGGLVGENFEGVISDSYSTGTVAGDTAVGGLVGGNVGTISNSHSGSEVKGVSYVGGLVGFNESTKGTINNSYSTGTVSGDWWVGGLAGGNLIEGKVNDSYSTSRVTGTGKYIGGLVGINWSEINNSYSIGIVTGNSSVGGLVGFSNEGGKINNSHSTGAVAAKEFGAGGLVGLSNKSNINNSYSIGTVTGTNDVGGLVGNNKGGKINSSYSTGKVTAGDFCAGGLVGQNTGVISNSYSIGAVTAENFNVGGFAGENGGEISNSFSTGATSGNNSIGGFVGQNFVLTTEDINSINYANNIATTTRENVSNGTIINSYSIGKVTGQSKVGGFIGRRPEMLYGNKIVGYSDKIINSYCDAETSGKRLYVVGNDAEGKTTAQMKQKATFKGWDFNKTWGIKSTVNNGYPYLLGNKP